MLRFSLTAKTIVALLAVTFAEIALPRAARAETTTLRDGTLSGEQTYDVLVIAGKVTVTPYDALQPGTGSLHIKANQITVMGGAVLSATAAGYAGQNLTKSGSGPGTEGTGAAEMDSLGGGKAGGDLGLPGGGGGYGGKGANGANKDCGPLRVLNNNNGGAEFYSKKMQLTMGSAGGAANVDFPTNKGGRGGGMITLEAARIVIDGRVEADGESPLPAAGVAPGGGSGGAVVIIAGQLTGSGGLSARGGNGSSGGGDMPKIEPNKGGGGGGGVIQFSLPASNDSTPLVMNTDVTAGSTGDCMMPTDAALPGRVVPLSLPGNASCVDVDGDTFLSSLCGGNDCDDIHAGVNPGASEVCDGIDNNCDGTVDEGDLCEAGEACAPMSDGHAACVLDPDAGGTPDAGPRPSHVEFEGGCGVMPGRGTAELPFWLLSAGSAAGALVLALRARSPRKHRKSLDRSR